MTIRHGPLGSVRRCEEFQFPAADLEAALPFHAALSLSFSYYLSKVVNALHNDADPGNGKLGAIGQFNRGLKKS